MTLISSSPPSFINYIGIPSQLGAFQLDICRIASFTSISNTSGSSSYQFSLKISFILESFLYRFSVYFCHLFFISFSSETTLPVLSFIIPQLELREPVISFISLIIGKGVGRGRGVSDPPIQKYGGGLSMFCPPPIYPP